VNQQSIKRQCNNWYTGLWRLDCYVWYSDKETMWVGCTKYNNQSIKTGIPIISHGIINTLMGTVKPQSNTAIPWLALWPLMGGLLNLVHLGGASAGCGPAQSSPHCTKYNSLPNSYYSMWHHNCLCSRPTGCRNSGEFSAKDELPLPLTSTPGTLRDPAPIRNSPTQRNELQVDEMSPTSRTRPDWWSAADAAGRWMTEVMG